MSKVAVVLAGCGFMDGSEVHESVLTLLALAQAGHEVQCYAPDREQAKVVNHLSGEEESEKPRNVLQESARIARGDVSPLADLRVAEYDAIMIPGGFGAAMNLCSFAMEGEKCSVDDDLRTALIAFHEQQKPIGATCISPVILAKVFEGSISLEMTLGNDADANQNLSAMGMVAVPVGVQDCVVDADNMVYTTPCYMESADLAGMFEGIKKVVEHLG